MFIFIHNSKALGGQWATFRNDRASLGFENYTEAIDILDTSITFSRMAPMKNEREESSIRVEILFPEWKGSPLNLILDILYIRFNVG